MTGRTLAGSGDRFAANPIQTIGRGTAVARAKPLEVNSELGGLDMDKGLIGVRISGAAGAGKTIARRAIIEPLQAAGFRVFVIDDPWSMTPTLWEEINTAASLRRVAVIEDYHQEAAARLGLAR